jgi:hypothetical protein
VGWGGESEVDDFQEDTKKRDGRGQGEVGWDGESEVDDFQEDTKKWDARG